MEHLFIGGKHDGQRIHVREGMDFVKLEYNEGGAMPSGDKDVEMELGCEMYSRLPLCFNATTIDVFIIGGMSGSRVWDMLLNGYSKTLTERGQDG